MGLQNENKLKVVWKDTSLSFWEKGVRPNIYIVGTCPYNTHSLSVLEAVALSAKEVFYAPNDPYFFPFNSFISAKSGEFPFWVYEITDLE